MCPNLINANRMKRFLASCYRTLEYIVIFGVTLLIVYHYCNEYDCLYDRACYIDDWEMFLITLFWVFFISIPIALVYAISFFRAIPFRTNRQKIVLAGHILNIVLWFTFYLSLPQTQPCTAAEMEQYYVTHHQAINDIIEFTRCSMKDSCAIQITKTPKGALDGLTVQQIIHQQRKSYILDPDRSCSVDTLFALSGITPPQFRTIQSMMDAADILAIDINNGDKHFNQSWFTLRHYGRTEYQFVINHNPNDSTYLTPDGIFINDSVKIIAEHNMVGHDFPDRETYLNRHNKNLH